MLVVVALVSNILRLFLGAIFDQGAEKDGRKVQQGHKPSPQGLKIDESMSTHGTSAGHANEAEDDHGDHGVERSGHGGKGDRTQPIIGDGEGEETIGGPNTDPRSTENVFGDGDLGNFAGG